MSYPAWAEGLVNIDIKYELILKNTILDELLVLDRNTCNHANVCKQIVLEK